MNSVDPLNNSLYFTAAAQAAAVAAQAKKKDTDLSKTTAKKRLFSEMLQEAETETETEQIESDAAIPEIAGLNYAKAVEILLDDVYSSGNDLRKNQTPEGVRKYRHAVKNFVSYVVQNCYYIEKHESSRSIKKRKKFYQIEILDKKLERLAAEVLVNQRDQMAFLAKIDEINGILVDLIT